MLVTTSAKSLSQTSASSKIKLTKSKKEKPTSVGFFLASFIVDFFFDNINNTYHRIKCIMNEKSQIIDLIKNKPKHYSKMIQNTPELFAWVKQNSLISEKNFAAEIYSAISNTTNICEKGKTKTFSGINTGWRFCGKAADCVCAKNSVSKNCKEKAKLIDKISAAEKRANTNLSRYGYENAGQSIKAKHNHAEFYSNKHKVDLQLDNQKQTVLERYGVTNVRNIKGVTDKIKQTMFERYGVENPQQNEQMRLKSIETKKIRYHERHLVECSYDRLNEKFKLSGYEFVTTRSEYRGVDQSNTTKYTFVHNECETEFETYIYSGHVPVCPKCFYTNPSYVSAAEKELADWIESFGIEVIRTESKKIAPMNLDIFLPEYNIAIEYCGLYWHSERANGKERSYHRKKYKACQEQSIRLITIFEDEWLNKKDLVKSILTTQFGKSNRIFARECEVKEVNNSESKIFLETNHLQGFVPASRIFALTHNDNLVSLMTFGRSRYSKKYQWELLRFCSLQNTIVIGGAEKLWKHFIKSICPDSVVSYCDLRWFDGNTYLKLGMKLNHISEPNYWYTDYKQRYNRSKYTKKSLIKLGFDEKLSESEIMINLKFDRIWDCGNKVFTYTQIIK
jgi:hypothetical protein